MTVPLTEAAERNIGSCSYCRAGYIGDVRVRHDDITMSLVFCEPGGNLLLYLNTHYVSVEMDDIFDDRFSPYHDTEPPSVIHDRGLRDISQGAYDRILKKAGLFPGSDFEEDAKLLTGGKYDGEGEPPF